MPGNDKQNKLAAYVVFSIILHLLLLYFIPFGFMQGNVRGENTDLNDYGYIQMVEYQPAPLQTEEPVPQEEIEEITAEQEEIPEEKEETQAEEVEEPEEIEEPEPEPEQEPEIDENTEVEPDITEEELTQENISAEDIEEEAEDIEEEVPDEEANDIENTETTEETEVLSSEESDVEVEIEEEQNTAEDTAQNTENVEPDEEEVEQSPPPPPPPTSGELISVMVRPAFPKDLVSSRAEGTVKLTAEITPGGAVKDVTVSESSGYDTMDRVAVLTIERGWSFKAYNKAYLIPIEVKYYIDESDNSQVDVNLGNVEFLTGGE